MIEAILDIMQIVFKHPQTIKYHFIRNIISATLQELNTNLESLLGARKGLDIGPDPVDVLAAVHLP